MIDADVNFFGDSHVSRKCTYTYSKDTILFMQGFIEPRYFMVLKNPTVQFSVKGGTDNLSQIFSMIYLQIGDSMFLYDPKSGDTQALFLGGVHLKTRTSVKMFAKVRQDVCLDDDVEVRFARLDLYDFSLYEYECNQEQVKSSLGAISGRSVKLNMFR
ncbi:TPA: hypothetical protein DEP21_01685 [Patescibacteria group bacterium]|nr:hypothetical protein [Candidatus Gracilibacteria bacterium]